MAFRAQYPGTCCVCRKPILVGSEITWTRRGGGKGRPRHIGCRWPEQQPIISGDSIPARPEPVTTDPVPQGDTGRIESNGAGAILDLIAQEVSRRLPDPATTVDEDRVNQLIRDAMAEVMKPTVIHVTLPDRKDPVVLEGTHHVQFPKLLYLFNKRGIPGADAYLYGPSQSGKTTAAKNLAKAFNVPFYTFSLGPSVPDSRILGYNDATGKYVGTVFHTAYTQGGVCLIDEVDNASGSLLTTLNSMFSNHIGSFPCGMATRHPDFYCVTTGNTPGLGGTPHYPERRVLDGAFRQRFSFILWEYDLVLEETVTLSINPTAKPFLAWVRAVREYVEERNIRLLATPTASFLFAEYDKDGMLSREEIAEAVVFKGAPKDVVSQILRTHPLPPKGA